MRSLPSALQMDLRQPWDWSVTWASLGNQGEKAQRPGSCAVSLILGVTPG